MKKPMVKLNDGTKVPLEQFVTWSKMKQNNRTMPIEEKIARYEKVANKHRRRIQTPEGTFSSMVECVQKTGITISPLRRLLYSEDFPDYKILNPIPDDENRRIKKVTQAEKDARQANKGLTRRRAVITPRGTFPSVTAASTALKLMRAQLTRLLQSSAHPEFRYATPKPSDDGSRQRKRPNKTKRVRRPDEVVTPKGRFVTRIQAALALNISSRELEDLLVSKPKKYYVVSRKKRSQAK